MRLPSLFRAAATLGLMASALMTPAAASADDAGGVGFRVDGGPGSSLQEGFIVLPASPGSTVSGHFFMTNSEANSVNLSLYPADGLTGTTTGVVYGDAGDAIRGAGAWVRPSMSSARLEKKSEQQVDFTVQVPSGAQSGDHVASVVLQQDRPSAGISQVVRNVVPLMIEVSGAASPQVAIRSADITGLPGTALPAVTVDLGNVGKKLCRPILTVGLDGKGNTGPAVTRQLDTILPGDHVPFPLPWPQAITPGRYVAHVTATGCGATRTLNANVTTPGYTGGKDKPKDNGGSAGTGTSGSKKSSTGNSGGANTSTSGQGLTPAATDTGDKPAVTPVEPPPASTPSSAAAGIPAAAAGPGLLKRISRSVKKNAPAVAERATVPLMLLALMGIIFFAQEAIDRKDPKLALAPLHRESDLAFDPDPLDDGVSPEPLVPLPTQLPQRA